jgi:hypothetical protein
MIQTVANFRLLVYGSINPHATTNLPNIWKNAPKMDPLEKPNIIRIMSMIWKV